MPGMLLFCLTTCFQHGVQAWDAAGRPQMAVESLDEYRKPHGVPQSQLSRVVHTQLEQIMQKSPGAREVTQLRDTGQGTWGHIPLPEGQIFWCFTRSQKSGLLWATFYCLKLGDRGRDNYCPWNDHVIAPVPQPPAAMGPRD